MMNSIDMDRYKVEKIIGNSKRFVSPFHEPCSYYICSQEEISDIAIELYLDKLKYMVNNAEAIIHHAFTSSYFDFYGVNKKVVSTPEMMCHQLVIDSFVLYLDDKKIGSYLSNSQFMFGHYIECLWNDRWKLLYSTIC